MSEQIIPLTSFEHVKQAIKKCQAAHAIEEYEAALKKEDAFDKRFLLLLNSAIAKLSMQLCRGCINDLKSALYFNSTSSTAAFFLGLSYLWMQKEKEAIKAWGDGLSHGGPISYFSVMKRLTVDHNARAFLVSKRFNVLDVIQFIEEFDKTAPFSDSDVQNAYKELFTNSLNSAITHFNLILANDPHNIEAIKGRGCAECLSGQWKRAIDDLTYVINKNQYVGTMAKFRGVANAALGNYSAAVADFSISVQIGPYDIDVKIERARLHMIRKCYILALEDFTSVPFNNITELNMLDIAECYYAVGDIPHAADVIQRIKSENDHRKAYIHYLICRDSGHLDEASLQIAHAVELLPSFFLLRSAGDFMYDQGRLQDAANYYRIALEQKENDAETMRYYALSLFQTGAEIQAVEILKRLAEAFETQRNEVDMTQDTFNGIFIKGPIKNFYQDQPNESILKMATDDLYYISHLMNCSDKPISEARRNASGFEDVAIPEVFHFAKFRPTQEELKMINDADILGQRCITRAPEIIENNRIIRCLGFCVLCLAQKMRTEFFVNHKLSWKDAINYLRNIMSLADLKNCVQWTSDAGTIVYSDLAPTFYIQRGQRRSPRFGHATQPAINRLRSGLSDKGMSVQKKFETSPLLKLNTLDAIYSVTQSDLRHYGSWTTNNNMWLPNPTVNLRYLGPNGYELFVRPPLEAEDIRKYDAFMQKTWETLMEQHSMDNSTVLPMMMLLIWLLHPISHYCNEFGHVIMHSYLLASKNAEVERISSPQGELFIKQMTSPNFETMKKTINDHLMEKKIAPIVKPESISYWDNLPTIAHLYPLIDYNPTE
ncbi:hypothetical protein TRFO_21661 [Tritrichomonas foetus]|uniref:TPR Domain containing protein n=1 Tax=Tritrichomonas foetus TaxID=1144522 RepID=A0A1J4KJA4_9EUKA|nr:hypothetical protein TRFO_21661 [Tritrichomonas foetus]|eukprot:OHT09429.1 hypothetical protein TRFO_21661 [Tritrichomonas foetus]